MREVKLFTILLLLYSSLCLHSQAGYAIFTPQNQNKAYLYKSAYSMHVVDSIVNDSVAEVLYCVSINKAKRNRALVSTFVGGGLIHHSGWLEWENLGIRMTCDTVLIREKPNSNAAVIDSLYMPYWIDVYPIRKAKNEWLYIDDERRNVKGWIAPEHQCSNPYTTCN